MRTLIRDARIFDGTGSPCFDGSVLIEGHRIQITDKGRPYMRLVASAFDTYLAQAKSRHSVAV